MAMLRPGCDSNCWGLSRNQGFTFYPARRLGHAHAVSGWKHARNGRIWTPATIGARLSPRSLVASPNHCAWLPWGRTFLAKPLAFVGRRLDQAIKESIQPANQQPRQISRVMRFAEVKEEVAQRLGDT